MGLDMPAQFVARGFLLFITQVLVFSLEFNVNVDAVQIAITIQMDLIALCKVFYFKNLFFDLGREHVDAANDQHVIAAPGDLVQAPHRPRSTWQQACQVAGTVADHGQGLLAQGGEHQFAHLPVRQHFACHRIDDFRVEVVFPNSQPVLGFRALHGHTRAHDFREAVDIQGGDAHTVFDGAAQLTGPGFGTEDA